MFPRNFASRADAEAVVAQGQAAIAERIYGKRPKLGNVHLGDGYKFRGRGIIQLTGRDNYRRAGRALGVDLEAQPDQVAELEMAIRTALWFWRSNPEIVAGARAGDVARATKPINPGLAGLADRQKKYDAWRLRLQIQAERGVPAASRAKP